MNYQDFAKLKQEARERLGPGNTLICEISAEDFEELSKSGYAFRQYEAPARPQNSVPDALHADIIFRIKPVPEPVFYLYDDSGPYMCI
jgi:hypothetical protein